MEYLREEGFPCYAASVAPEGSAWDRACELYAQLAGTVVDYGKAHSERCSHERYGRDFSGESLIPDWGEDTRLVLLGHSFGGATVRLFSEILANGSSEEQSSTEPDELSDFFKGDKADHIHAIVTLAAPTNGTTAYDMYEDENFKAEKVEVSPLTAFWGSLFSARKSEEKDGRSEEDYAAYDMHIDNALALNAQISTLPDTYYFAVPCSATEKAEDGTYKPVDSLMEGMFRQSSARMGSYTGTTAGGFTIDDSWRENDGLVNTVSAMAPIGEPSQDYDTDNIKTGIWNVMPVYIGDHMSLQGGMTIKNDIREYYRDLLEVIERLP